MCGQYTYARHGVTHQPPHQVTQILVVPLAPRILPLSNLEVVLEKNEAIAASWYGGASFGG